MWTCTKTGRQTVFYDVFFQLCQKFDVKPTPLAKELGFNPASITYWKKTGSSPKPEILEKIAAYFNVSTDYLLGNTYQKEKSPAKAESDDITFDDFTYAFHNEAKDLSVEEKNALLEMAKALKRAKEGK